MDLYFVFVRKIAKKNLSNIQPILTSCLVNNAYTPYFLEQAPGRLFKISAERGGGGGEGAYLVSFQRIVTLFWPHLK